VASLLGETLPSCGCASTIDPATLSGRPPNLCAGCSHRAVYYAVRKVFGDEAIYSSDIGCYTLGMVPPLRAADFLFCMGSSVSAGSGFAMISDRPVVGFIGDSTFFHSGMTGLANAVFNKHDLLLVILDNGTTAMTGHQPNPGVASAVLGEGCEHLDIESIVRGIGVTDVAKVKPFNLRATLKTLEDMKSRHGVRVIIAEEPCMLFARRTLKQERPQVAEVVQQGADVLACLTELACPAFRRGGDAASPEISIDATQCSGCMVCLQTTPSIRARKRSEK
ncbi:MAG: thiamine pyrophosphate-dependent enzyme, partial [Bilophila sp.]